MRRTQFFPKTLLILILAPIGAIAQEQSPIPKEVKHTPVEFESRPIEDPKSKTDLLREKGYVGSFIELGSDLRRGVGVSMDVYGWDSHLGQEDGKFSRSTIDIGLAEESLNGIQRSSAFLDVDTTSYVLSDPVLGTNDTRTYFGVGGGFRWDTELDNDKSNTHQSGGIFDWGYKVVGGVAVGSPARREFARTGFCVEGLYRNDRHDLSKSRDILGRASLEFEIFCPAGDDAHLLGEIKVGKYFGEDNPGDDTFTEVKASYISDNHTVSLSYEDDGQSSLNNGRAYLRFYPFQHRRGL